MRKLLKNIGRSLRLIGVSFIATSTIVTLWCIFREDIYRLFEIEVVKHPTGRELDAGLAFFMPGILYGAIEGFVLNQIMGQNRRLLSAIDTLNAVMFLEERDRRTHWLIHLIMFFITCLTVGMAMLYQYPSMSVAIFTIGTCTFLGILAFVVAIELDNPFTGIWKIQDNCTIPDKWMEMTAKDIMEGTVPNFRYELVKKNGHLLTPEKKEPTDVLTA